MGLGSDLAQAVSPSEQLAGTVTPPPVSVFKQDLIDLAVTACEGGIGHWSRLVSGYRRGERPSYQADAEFGLIPLVVATWEDEGLPPGTSLQTPAVVTPEVLLRGLQAYCDRFVMSPADVLEMMDAQSADEIVQLGLFGEVVYS